jgi:hypothetical protein
VDGHERVHAARFDHAGTAASHGLVGFVVRSLHVEFHPSALEHGLPVEDIQHAVRYAMVSDDLGDDLRLYLGLGRSASLIEVVVIVGGGGRSELVIHAMPLREKYRRLLPGES